MLQVPAARAESLRQVERYLRQRATAAGPEPDGPEIRVAPLGLVDLLWSRPTEPSQVAQTGRGGRVLPVYLYDASALVGPATWSPGRPGPCFHCVARRWQQIRIPSERDAIECGQGFHAAGRIPYLSGFALDALWLLVDRVRRPPAGRAATDPAGHPYLYELPLDTLLPQRHAILADADCPVCGDRVPDTAAGAVLELVPRPKPTPDRYRLRHPSDYQLQAGVYANPVCGALGPRAEHEGESTTTAPVIGCLPVRGSGYLHYSYWGGHSDQFDQSMRLGILEGLERHAGIRPRRVVPTVQDTHRNLHREALDPRDVGVYSDECYRRQPRYAKWTPDLKLSWVWGYSLRDHRPVLVPELMTYYHGEHVLNKFLQDCSSGCAAGSCLEEAILHGLLELVERDAFLLCWYGRFAAPEIDPQSCQDDSVRFMVDRFSLLGYDVRLFDLRVTFPIPVVTAVAVRRDGGLGTLCFSAGGSLTPESAIRTALYEIAAQVPALGQRTERALDELRELARDYRKVRELHQHPRMYGLPEMARHAGFLLHQGRPPARVSDAYREWERQRPANLDLLDDLRYCVRLVTAAGFDVLAVDQTSPEQIDAGVHTARVLAPGLLPIDFGWEAQRARHLPRLRTALREAGLRPRDLTDSDLNPAPHPFP